MEGEGVVEDGGAFTLRPQVLEAATKRTYVGAWGYVFKEVASKGALWVSAGNARLRGVVQNDTTLCVKLDDPEGQVVKRLPFHTGQVGIIEILGCQCLQHGALQLSSASRIFNQPNSELGLLGGA